MDDTIYGLSTPVGNGISVIRISGVLSEPVLRACFTHKGEYESHKLYYGSIIDTTSTQEGSNGVPIQNDEIIDEALCVLMRAPRSYTAEDCAELQCHGSSSVVRTILQMLSRLCIDGQKLRAAEAGEFTRRAFMNGRLELSQAEAVMDLISASAQAGAKAALAQIRGSVGRKIHSLCAELTDAIARIEAGIDYPEEDWADDGELVLKQVESCAVEVRKLLSTAAQGRLLRDGIKIAIIGRPNAGKSSLLNALLGERRAIVSALPGTTRDVIEEQMDIGGLPVRIADTAGLREALDEVEAIGVSLAKETMADADLVLLVFDGAQPLNAEDYAVIAAAKEHAQIGIVTKSDLPQVVDLELLGKALRGRVVTTAAPTQGDPQGLDELKEAIRSYFESLSPIERSGTTITNSRHAQALTHVLASLSDALCTLDSDLDCASIDLRRALHALGEITGETLDEAIIDRIFEKFCLGK